MESFAEPYLQDQEAVALRGEEERAPTTEALVESACEAIPPLWPLRHFVAVNPYLGLTDRPFEEALGYAERVFDAPASMKDDYYQRAYREGRFDYVDLQAAARLSGDAPAEEAAFPTAVDVLEAKGEARLESLVVDEISRWCAGRFDAGQATWKQPWRDEPVFEAWRAHAQIDRSAELRGLPGLRAYVAGLPAEPHAVIDVVMSQLGVPVESREEYLARLLGSILGWAGHAQYRRREARMRGGDDDALVALLAIRAAFDGAIGQAFSLALDASAVARIRRELPSTLRLHRPLVLQRALENGYQRRLLEKLSQRDEAPRAARPELQIACCIDVRSEVLRRHLEQQSGAIETIGFAGFFGVAVEYEAPEGFGPTSRCPALIAPPMRAEERSSAEERAESVDRGARRGWFNALRKQTVGSFPFVETVGWFFGLRLLGDSMGWSQTRPDGILLPVPERKVENLELVDPATGGVPKTTDIAESILRGMGLIDRFAPIVVLCGHGGHSPNNPFASALDCGACGGHAGDLNARVAVDVLNDPAVRESLVARGIEIPADTVFVAALHETTSDRIELLEPSPAASPKALARIGDWLEEASAATREERLASMGDPSGWRSTDAEIRRRSRDWSETRPEWALARNAAFIAAPRTRSRALDLEGRTFLHDYDAGLDPDAQVLNTILTAPMVVASWINLQYYGSTVAPERFGAGDKTLHNVVSHLGVLEGNGGDLRVGLPLQSVHDGEDFVHEPLRLTGIVAAAPDKIDACIEGDEGLRNLVDHEWIHLIAWDLETNRFRRREPGSPTWTDCEEVSA